MHLLSKEKIEKNARDLTKKKKSLIFGELNFFLAALCRTNSLGNPQQALARSRLGTVGR